MRKIETVLCTRADGHCTYGGSLKEVPALIWVRPSSGNPQAFWLDR